MELKSYAAEKPFAQKHLLKLQDWTPDEIMQTLALAVKLKEMQKAGQPHEFLKGKMLAMIFAKDSLRTRVSFEVGMAQLGGRSMVMSEKEFGLGVRESVADVARVLSRMVDGIMIRTFEQEKADGLAQNGSVPVINALTDGYHPCQALADLLTLYEHKGALKGRKLAFVGDGNNVANSLMTICSKIGVDVAVAHAAGYAPEAAVVDACMANAKASGASLLVTTSLNDALAGADAVYTDVWASMGQEAETAKRKLAFADYQVNTALMAKAKKDAIFLHCLPAHRGEEVADEVMEAQYSKVFDEAENRVHAQKAVLAQLLGGITLGSV